MELLTANQIRTITFTPGRGYKDGEVDDLIDRCADTVEALQAKVDELNKKMEVLADKLVEYRNEEDSIRAALLSAQRLGDSIVREAKQKADLMLEDAHIKAEKVLENANREISDEQLELQRVKQEVADFKSQLLAMYRQHLSLIDLLPEPEKAEEPVEEPSAAEPVPAEEPVAVVPLAPVEEATPVIEEPETPVEESAPVEEEEDEVALVDSIWKPDDDYTEEEKAVIEEEAPISRFGELKFGKDYEINSAFKRRK
ncbi:MAG: DivIVA domain-containing protein [Clostridia bacterium]|nr:DivIVA domain-containing protein [Clostridia bacterium]